MHAGDAGADSPREIPLLVRVVTRRDYVSRLRVYTGAVLGIKVDPDARALPGAWLRGSGKVRNPRRLLPDQNNRRFRWNP